MNAIRFDQPVTINLKLTEQDLASRMTAVKELMLGLDGFEFPQGDIRASGGFEHSRIVVKIEMGLAGSGEIWSVDFHLVWPEPRLNNQHLNSVKLLSWVSAHKISPTTAGNARDDARTALINAINSMTGPDGQLAGRIRIHGPNE